MKYIIIDFADSKTLFDLHNELAQKLDFPDFYGQNLDALWDCLTGFIDGPLKVRFKGIKALPKGLQHQALRIYKIFCEAEEEGWKIYPSTIN